MKSKNYSNEIKEFQNKEQFAIKRLEKFENLLEYFKNR